MKIKQIKNPIFLLVTVFVFLSGCCDQSKIDIKPKLAYLVAYSILDNRFQTSTRLDITADILNGTESTIELVQLILHDKSGNSHTLDFQIIQPFSQEGRFAAVPLKAPITNPEILGETGIEYRSPSDLHFLFVSNFESATLKYRNENGIEEMQIQDLSSIMEKSRSETIEWMKKEYEQREKTLVALKQKSQEIVSDRRKKLSKSPQTEPKPLPDIEEEQE